MGRNKPRADWQEKGQPSSSGMFLWTKSLTAMRLGMVSEALPEGSKVRPGLPKMAHPYDWPIWALFSLHGEVSIPWVSASASSPQNHLSAEPGCSRPTCPSARENLQGES